MQFACLEYTPKNKDAMDISILAEDHGPDPGEARPAQEPEQPRYDLDAFGKCGKGKGWAVSKGGRCNICKGEGHFARYCPSQVGPDGKASGAMNCHGCNGKGHMKQDCPTANPALEGKGKGADADGWQPKSGKGWSPKGGDGLAAEGQRNRWQRLAAKGQRQRSMVG